MGDTSQTTINDSLDNATLSTATTTATAGMGGGGGVEQRHNDTGMGSSINDSPGSPRHEQDRHTPSTGSPHRGK